MTSTAKPARRALDLRSFDDLVAEVERLHASGYQRAGTWSLAQICDHLGMIMTKNIDGFSTRAPWVVRWVVRNFYLGRILRTRHMPTGIAAPAEIAPPVNPGEDADAVERFRATVARYRQFSDELQPSPIFGRLRRDQYDQIHLIHAAHHLSFLVPEKQGADAPRSPGTHQGADAPRSPVPEKQGADAPRSPAPCSPATTTPTESA